METIRLSKLMSERGLCSRREADVYIERGWVKVDGSVVSELGSKVLPTCSIELATQAQREQGSRVTILLNKPVGYVSAQAEDGYQPAVTLVTAANQYAEDHSGLRYSNEHRAAWPRPGGWILIRPACWY